ncbi:MAG TPA: hypothetical protein VHI78_10490, partial [Bacteroidales bacterium]|nr:hypothetical protein [Bacteroidales bacterium]
LGDYRHFTITSVISAGLGIGITKNTSIQLEPAFQFDLIPDYPKSSGHYWNLGLKTGFFRRF